MRLLDAAARLRDACEALSFGAPYVYDPLAYAWEPHARYLRRYGAARGRVVFVGMNPGPWGMAQTGIPFADPAWARGWLGVEGRVVAPPRAHPKRPVLGFASPRRDPSGAKFYGWARERFGTADAFFSRCFVTNVCPLMFLDEGGRNVVPPALPKRERAPLEEACDAWLAEALDALAPSVVAAMGAYAEARVRAATGDRFDVRRILHPSPANPANNFGWGADLSFVPTAAAEPRRHEGTKGARRPKESS